MLSILLSLLLSTFFALAQDRIALLDGQQVSIPKLGSKEALGSHPRFNAFIVQMFNRPGDFHGPNCYNTALITSGVFSSGNRRYVSPEEFEAILKNNFSSVTRPGFQDLVVFDAKASRGHAAFYLGDDLIFHKKSFGTHYHYRITEMGLAGVVEENEWTPGPVDDSSAQMNWPELGRLPKEYYRLQKKLLPPLDQRLAPFLTNIETLLVADLKQWAIAKKWGMTGEYLLEDLLKYARAQKTDKYTEGLIISLKDQIFVFLEEVYFKRARSASRVLEDLCLPEQKDQLFGLIRELGKILKKETTKVEEVLKKLEQQDKSRCQLHPLDEILS